MGVVPHVGICHKERAAPYPCAPFGLYAAVDDHILAYHHVVTDVAVGEPSLPTEVLRVGTYNGTLEHLAVLAHACSADDACEGHYHAVVAYFHILVDECERMDGDVLAYLCRWVDVSFVANHNIIDLEEDGLITCRHRDSGRG